MSDLRLEGVHHISCITGDAPGNVEFYAGLLGMRMVKKTVNQDDPSVYHLFYGDEKGSPGFDLTFFEYPGARPGRAGAGMIHRILWRLPSAEALTFWKERLEAAGTETSLEGESLRFTDPEGLDHEFEVYTGDEPALVPRHKEIPPEFAIQGFQGVRVYSGNQDFTEEVLGDVLGFAKLGDGLWQRAGEDRSGTYQLDPPPDERGIPGAGTVHHIAWASPLDQHEQWQEKVSSAGLQATPVIDRFYFKAVYFREPGGVLFELATIGPGFTTDEEAEHLGERLSLPPDFESVREHAEATLTPVPDVRQWRPDAD
ncbi:MAG: VOC family protein [Thermoleophilia bacterium]|nr:VOC family protein [Thermoleophilia bacterium]